MMKSLIAGLALGMGALFAQDQWVDRNPPLPTGEDLHAVHFVDANRGFAAGRQGVLLKTDDGGRTWAVIPTGTAEYLYAVSFSDRKMGIAVGGFGTVLRSVDGGDSWMPIAKFTSATFNNVHGRGETFLAASDSGLFKSSDSGKTWAPVGPRFRMGAACVKGGQTLFAAGGAGYFLGSSDAGANWSQQRLDQSANLEFSSLFFRGADTGFLAGTRTYLQGRGFVTESFLMKTVDGGTHWAEKPGLARQSFGLSVDFRDGFQGLAMTWDSLFRTGDGGETWTRAKSLPFARHVGMLSAGTFVAAGNAGTVYRTEDSGTTWTRISGRRDNLIDIHFPDPATGFALTLADGNPALYKTVNGGRDWVFAPGRIEGPAFSYLSLNALEFRDAKNGFAAGNGMLASDSSYYSKGLLLRTRDGGTTWTVSQSVERMLRKVHFVSDRVGFAAGDGGTLLKTADGGDTWAPKATAVSNDLLSLQFIDASTGFAMGINRMEYSLLVSETVLLKTVDGGETWARHATLPDLEGAGIRFIDANTAVLIGGQSPPSRWKILKTRDGGSQWTVVSQSDSIAFIRGLSFADARNGFAVTDRFLVRTYDGGDTWSVQPLPSPLPTSWMGPLFFPDATAGYAVGDRAAIYALIPGPPMGVSRGFAKPRRSATLNGNDLWFWLPRAARVEARLLDVRGRESWRYSAWHAAGSHSLALPAIGGSKGWRALDFQAGAVRTTLPMFR